MVENLARLEQSGGVGGAAGPEHRSRAAAWWGWSALTCVRRGGSPRCRAATTRSRRRRATVIAPTSRSRRAQCRRDLLRCYVPRHVAPDRPSPPRRRVPRARQPSRASERRGRATLLRASSSHRSLRRLGARGAPESMWRPTTPWGSPVAETLRSPPTTRSCATVVGMGGHTAAGGFGLLSWKFTLATDNVANDCRAA